MSQTFNDGKLGELEIINSTENGSCAISAPHSTMVDNPQNHVDHPENTTTPREVQIPNSISAESIANQSDVSTNTKSSKSYKDFSGIDTESFIIATLRDQPKDRPFLLSLENIFREFIEDNQREIHQFETMNSYERMIVHRVAAFFGLKHNIDQTGQAVLVEKTADTRIPELTFQSIISPDNTNFSVAKTSSEVPINGANVRSEVSTNETLSSKNNESKDKVHRATNNRAYRKQNSSTSNGFDFQHRQVQLSSHQLNQKNQSAPYNSIMFPAYPQQQIVSGSSMHNFIPMVTAHPTPYQHGVSLGPILLQPTTNTAMSYVYPLPNPHQISFVNPTTPITSIYPVNNSNSSPIYPQAASLVHVYPTTTVNPYFNPNTVPQTHVKPIDYPTNQFAMLNLQPAAYDSHVTVPIDGSIHYRGQYLVQSSTKNGSGPRFISSRQSRLNQPDKIKSFHQSDTKSTVHNQQPN